MNKKQFEVWQKQRRRDYEIELEKLREDFARRGLAFSGMRNKAEDDLRQKYKSEIEITRIGIEDSGRGHVAVKMTESARNNVFINSQIHGGMEIAGQGNNFIETKINPLKEKHPFWFWFGTVGTFIGIITGLMYLADYFGYLPIPINIHSTPTSTTETIATSTMSLADILSKALDLETVVERQDFLQKYIGSTVFAQGTVSEVSRSGAGGFLVDLKVVGQTVTCQQEASEENEKQLLLLKGKRVQIVGKFPFSEIWGHGLGIDECVLTRL